MNAHYLEQAKLMAAALPFMAQEPQFALKGGTAINLFENDLPRLSTSLLAVLLVPRPASIIPNALFPKREPAILYGGCA